MTPPSLGREEEIPTAPAAQRPAQPAAVDGPRLTADVIASRRLGAKGPDGLSPIASALARIEARRSKRERPVATPWNGVNEALGGGLWPGFYVLVGGTGAGKSQWALQLGLHAAGAEGGGVPVLYLALELDTFGMVCRALSAVAHEQGVHAPPWSALYRGAEGVATPGGETVDALAALPFHVVEADAHGFGHDEIADAVAAFRALYPRESHPSALVVLDFLQLVSSPPDAREDLRERISHAAYQCRVAARTHDVAVLALSSTARRVGENNPMIVTRGEGDAPKRAALHDLVGMGKESGDVEYSADGVLVLCREPWEASKPQGGKVVHLAVAKLRAGEGSWCALRFDGTVFADDVTEDGPAGGADEVSPGASKGKRGVRK